MFKKLILIIIVFVGIYVLTQKNKGVLHNDPKLALRQLSSIAQKQGVLQAQAYFLKNFFSYSDNNRHYLGHFLGEHIYKTYGLSGISHCYSHIEFGCIHGFLLSGYLHAGKSFLTLVKDQCKQDLPAGCMHGLGHAFLLTSGYEKENLRASLDDCMNLDVKKEGKEECTQGVYMEYNDRFMLNNQSSVNEFVPRTFDPLAPLAPCDTEPAILQPICFRELVLYWTNISGITQAKMAEYCNLISPKQGKYECFWSIGGVIAGDDAIIDRSLSTCEAIAGNFVHACLHGAVLSVAFQSQKPKSSFCKRLPDMYKKECEVW